MPGTCLREDAPMYTLPPLRATAARGGALCAEGGATVGGDQEFRMTGEETALDEPFAAELGVALRAACAAAALIQARGGAAEVREKGRADLVTAVDEAAERAISQIIRSVFPDDRIVGEELSSERVHTGRRWYVDPIDGTTNFVHGHPFV